MSDFKSVGRRGDPDVVEKLRDLHRHTAGEAADEIEQLRAEVAAFREAIRVGDGPSCEDVCMRECIGVCGAQDDWAAQRAQAEEDSGYDPLYGVTP